MAPGTTERLLNSTPLATGSIVHKDVKEGDYVQTGMHLYSVADLSRLWVELDAYESDLPLLSVGQAVSQRLQPTQSSVRGEDAI